MINAGALVDEVADASHRLADLEVEIEPAAIDRRQEPLEAASECVLQLRDDCDARRDPAHQISELEVATHPTPLLVRECEAVAQHPSRAIVGGHLKSAAQLRGIDVLALYDDELVFVRLMVGRQIRIPTDARVEVTTAKSRKGKPIFRDLLKVTWRLDGGTQSVVWFVVDLQGWLDALGRARLSASVPT